MRLMGLEAVAPKPKTSEPHPEHPVYPYLLRGLTISRANQVWATDITYIPMAHGFAYLVAIIDWYSRRVLSWRLSNTLDTSFCVEALEEALSRFRQAGDLQHRPGLAVHGGGLHGRAADGRGQDQHGRQGSLHRQRLRRAALAFAQVRGGLSATPTTTWSRRAPASVATSTSTTRVAAPGARLSDARVLLRWACRTGSMIVGGNVKSGADKNRAMETAGAVDAQTDARPQAPWTPANGRRRPQFPQPKPKISQRQRTSFNPSRPHLSRPPFWSEEWGPRQTSFIPAT